MIFLNKTNSKGTLKLIEKENFHVVLFLFTKLVVESIK